ncbi:MAG: hypothetical protein ACREBU_00505 [Nitrososphaera sp.]
MPENPVASAVGKAASWPFLQEPIWRWFVFFVALGLIFRVWAGILSFMK